MLHEEFYRSGNSWELRATIALNDCGSMRLIRGRAERRSNIVEGGDLGKECFRCNFPGCTRKSPIDIGENNFLERLEFDLNEVGLKAYETRTELGTAVSWNRGCIIGRVAGSPVHLLPAFTDIARTQARETFRDRALAYARAGSSAAMRLVHTR